MIKLVEPIKFRGWNLVLIHGETEPRIPDLELGLSTPNECPTVFREHLDEHPSTCSTPLMRCAHDDVLNREPRRGYYLTLDQAIEVLKALEYTSTVEDFQELQSAWRATFPHVERHYTATFRFPNGGEVTGHLPLSLIAQCVKAASPA